MLMLFFRYMEQTSVNFSSLRMKSGIANSLRVSGGTPRGLSSIQAYCENDILLVSLEEDTERVG
tara:strand:- start:358 stop:549 length:192 start_codon:yes stop_codon:yes gene_type:complete